MECRKRPKTVGNHNARAKNIDEMEDLSSCIELKKFLLSGNKLKQLDEGIGFMNSLTYLDVSHNHLDSLNGIQRLTRLSVLNASHNQLVSIEFTEKLVHLKALILNHNRISMIENIGHLKELNTLILSNNHIEKIQGIKGLIQLKKLSLAHNHLRELPSLDGVPELKELRLNANKIMRIPKHLVYNSGLEFIDLGNNIINDLNDLDSLSLLIHLQNVNLRGNPICKDEHYRDKMDRLVPPLKVLDGKRIDERYLKRKRRKSETHYSHDPLQKMYSSKEREEKVPNSQTMDKPDIIVADTTFTDSRNHGEIDKSDKIINLSESTMDYSHKKQRIKKSKRSPEIMKNTPDDFNRETKMRGTMSIDMNPENPHPESGIVRVIEGKCRATTSRSNNMNRHGIDPSSIPHDEDMDVRTDHNAWS